MFYEVRVLDEKGDVKKVISSKKLSRDFWRKNVQPQDFPGKKNYDEVEMEQDWKQDLAPGKMGIISETID